MQRQKSILSFFQKPDANRPNPPGREPSPASHPVLEIRGTDTPPEKVRRPLFPSVSPPDGVGEPQGSGKLASILNKFRRDGRLPVVVADERNQDENAFLSSNLNFGQDSEANANMKKDAFSKDCTGACLSMFNDDYLGGYPSAFDLCSDSWSPETPLVQPLVPPLKRVQEDYHTVETEDYFPLFCPRKRAKSVLGIEKKKKTCENAAENSSSKFEWLSPWSIRDASGRSPSDPLYDKRTLYIPPDALKNMSASQKQYWTVKSQYMDVILFFKVGKFYELYELDAEIGQKELDWKMTVSGVGKCRQVGISESGIDDAVQKLISFGYKVGRMEQLETSVQAKTRGKTAVIERKLIHVSTPSTAADTIVGPNAVHLLALQEGMDNSSPVYGFAFLDYAALKVWVGCISDDDSCAALGTLLIQVSPKEIIYESGGLSKGAQKALVKYASAGPTSVQLNPVIPGTDFLDPSEVRNFIHSEGYFLGSNSWTSTFDSLIHQDLGIRALGGLTCQLNRLKLDDVLRNGELLPYHVYKSCLRMDGQTLGNLEIFSNNVNGGLPGTLYRHLDHCITSSGKRLLRKWICHPLKEIDNINDRLNIVEGLIKQSGVASIITEYSRKLPDLERLLGRSKAIVGSSSTLQLPLVGERILKQRVKAFGTLIKGLRVGMDLLIILQREDSADLPLSRFVDFTLLRDLDELLKQFELVVDTDFPQYQDHDIKDSDAEALATIVEVFVKKSNEWSQVIHALSSIDVLQAFAATAVSSCGSMSRPFLLPAGSSSKFSCQDSQGPVLKMKGLWHPYAVEESGNGLVPNDVNLGDGTSRSHMRALLLTGPNMGGKSTLLRATCLSVIMAQLGCFVPCDECVLTPVDVIFTRLGATDRIMSGESTFFVECSETASVLRYATQDSLVLLDELGRGTSTFDGYAIAYAVFRYLVEKVRCRLLFATHYHPLTKEFALHPCVSLQHMACAFNPPKSGRSFSAEHYNGLVFLYKLTSGAAPESYGLQVALIAGIPKHVVDCASVVAQRMKSMVSKNFKASEGRSLFSTLHEEWLKTLFALSRFDGSSADDDASDTLLCLWHEMRRFREPVEK